MQNYEAMANVIHDMEQIAQLFKIEPFPIYFLGGSACILGQYTDQMTRDFDLVDLHYPATLGRVLRYLNDFDMLEYESTILAPSFRARAKKLEQFTYLEIYTLAREDIIVSKIIRMDPKDIEDINELMKDSDKGTINIIIDEVLKRNDLFDSKREAFQKNLIIFREKYNV